MDLVRFALVGNYKRFYQDLKKIGKEKKKSPLLMFIDTALCVIFIGGGLQDYLNYRFYEKSWKERRKYVTIGYQAKMYKKMANIKYAPFFSNKPNFLRNFRKYTKRDWYDSEMEYEKLEEFLSIHDTFILKPIIGLGGTNVQKIETKTIVDRKKFYEDLKNKKMFIEEFIVQDPRWGEICPNSVNTLRVMTSVVNGKPKLFFAAARIGSGKYVVDNFHAGGMAALIDLETGKLIGNGFTKKLDEYERHPVTNIKIDGYEIPYWNEVKEMVLEAALVNENVNVVGWDVAITKDGPVIIEGNRGPGWDLVQVLLNKGTKYMLEDIKKEMKQHGLW